MKKTIVYYHPKKIISESNRGSDIRVSNMLSAFKELDFNVIEVAGVAAERHKIIKEIKHQHSQGLKIEFVYGESTNAPIALADKKWLPANSFMDYSFFNWLKYSKIPFGVFYRDIYWRFDFFNQMLIWPLSYIVKPLYYLDWYFYHRFTNILFLPSNTMNKYLPKIRAENSFFALPPGYHTGLIARPSYDITSSEPLKLLYVGGVDPTVYDISALMKIVGGRADVELTICCREAEWIRYSGQYNQYSSKNIVVAHVNTDDLAAYYHVSDLFLMVMGYSEYRDFSMPVKFFEAIGYAVPIISMNQKEVAHKVLSDDIGWVLNEFDQLNGLLDDLINNRKALMDKYKNMLSTRDSYSWLARASCAASKLLEIKV